MPDYNLKNKVVIITGASAGLGAACAEGFAAEGSFITITGRNKSGLEETAKKCQEIGLPSSKILSLVVDHSKEEDNQRTISETVEKFGQLDVLVNNAGLSSPGTIEESPLSNYDNVMRVNARAPYQLTQLALPHLRKTKGNIVNMSSVVSARAFVNYASYSMSKAALDNLTWSASHENAKYGVRVNAVNPGYIPTKINRRGTLTDQEIYEVEKQLEVGHPLGRNGTSSEIANAVLFLASDRASFITGATLPVDGGKRTVCP